MITKKSNFFTLEILEEFIRLGAPCYLEFRQAGTTHRISQYPTYNYSLPQLFKIITENNPRWTFIWREVQNGEDYWELMVSNLSIKPSEGLEEHFIRLHIPPTVLQAFFANLI
jgi:hypothetical protein